MRSFLPPHKRVVFVYHDISPPAAVQHSPHYSTTPESFARHLDFFQGRFHLVSLDEILSPDSASRGRTPRRPLAALTFDDGFLSVQERARPLLEERRIPYALFVNGQAMRHDTLEFMAAYEPPPHPAGVRFYLGPGEVCALARAGVQIGNHSTRHRPLAGCTDGELDDEVAGNKAYLEDLLGVAVRHFAIPYGKKQHYDTRALQRCFAAGHSHVYSTNPALFDASSVSGFARRPVPRIPLLNQSTSELLFLLNRPLFRRLDL